MRSKNRKKAEQEYHRHGGNQKQQQDISFDDIAENLKHIHKSNDDVSKSLNDVSKKLGMKVKRDIKSEAISNLVPKAISLMSNPKLVKRAIAIFLILQLFAIYGLTITIIDLIKLISKMW